MPSAEVLVPQITFEPGDLSAYGAAILSAGGPEAIRVHETSGISRKSMVVVARHADVVEVLTDEERFSVCHYTRQFAAIAPKGIGLLMREPSPMRTERYRILNAAAAETPWFTPGSAALDTLSRSVVADLLATFRRRPAPAFDIVSEYGFFAPYLIARQVIGMPGPPGWGLFECAITAAQGRRFTPETMAYLRQFVWSELVFAQLFADFENRNWALRPLAACSLRRMIGHIRARMQQPDPLASDPGRRTLLAAMLSKAVRGQFGHLTDAAYAHHVAYLMLELMGTAQVVPGLAFSGVIGRWADAGGLRDGWRQGLDGFEPARAGAFIDEQLRLSPPSTYLLRNATKPCKLGGIELAKDDYVCALVGAAGRDVPDPDTINLDRPPETYLHFGPAGGPHHCFGRLIGHGMLTAMFAGLKALPEAHAAGPMKSAMGVPTSMAAHFARRGRA